MFLFLPMNDEVKFCQVVHLNFFYFWDSICFSLASVATVRGD
jgi:hypothetical protein